MLVTRGTGLITKLRVRVNFGMWMVTPLKESGSMTKPMATEFTPTPMELNMRVTGRMTSNMVMVRRFGLMVLSMKVTIKKAKNTEEASMFGQMAAHTMVSGQTIK